MLFHTTSQEQQYTNPLVLLILIMAVAGCSGFALVTIGRSLLEKATLSVGIGCQLGLKAGWQSALMAGAILSVLSTWNVLAAPNSSEEAFLKTRMWFTWYVCLAALLPSVFCGFIGGAIGARLARSRIPSDLDSRPASAAHGYKWPFRLLSWLSFLLLASPLVFLGREPKIDPPPVIVATLPSTPVPAPSPFKYDVPAELSQSSFNQFRVGFVKTIGNVADSRAMSLSPDGRLFAYCSQRDGNSSITAFDLHAFKPVANFIVPGHPADSLVWSPDMKRLACLCRDGSASASLWILSLEDGLAVELPRPPEADVPAGEFFWWSAEELAFFSPDETPLIFRLDTLAFAPLDDSKFIEGKSEQEKMRWIEGPRFELPSSSHWQFQIAAGVLSNQPPPRKNQGAPWQWNQSFFCSFADPQSPPDRASSQQRHEGLLCPGRVQDHPRHEWAGRSCLLENERGRRGDR
ncbi:hypothetical protein EI77_00084 [Prosthecobacter fusiformis]|uniref:WD40 repeat protein n=1 Tax=Prosthecobacter fusiformis TaxID=48464 RepID=A0A4R7SRJ7_9BACT|nr:WD40 repeat domain-containing protein [Prosthecobacter fusiformis]TDU80787.1 hypothetical protein EI77_00084 [Prosthecobacter fusiformis]